jgi:hypothetical protein
MHTMKIDLSEKLRSLKWSLVGSRPIATLSWSAIRRIGQSRLLALTIVVPFLGSLLLFNQHVVELLTLSPELVRRWMGIPANGVDDAARQLTLARLYYVYFGLTFLGIGSALFSLFCPLIVKNYASSVEYIQIEGALVTKSRMGLFVTEVAEHFLSWAWDDESSLKPELLRQLGEPTDFVTLGSVSITEIFSDVPQDDPPGEEPSAAEGISLPTDDGEQAVEPVATVHDVDHFDDDPFYDHRGRPDAIKIAKILYYHFRPYQGFIEDFCNHANRDKHRNDVLTLRYLAVDNTKPKLRVAVSCFYGFGFALLLIPTAITFVQVAWHWLR